ncbi:LysR substrate-binding domain-containing protein [Staphylococcus pseudintermedius]|uniref:LysR substrate-binding domain-containing protein n=1 Tax=Staphylococcus pseudintermedius TaxID=283734 RepID=UPI003BF909C9
MRDQALEVCPLAGAGERTGFRATSLETLRQMVAADVGITCCPRWRSSRRWRRRRTCT